MSESSLRVLRVGVLLDAALTRDEHLAALIEAHEARGVFAFALALTKTRARIDLLGVESGAEALGSTLAGALAAAPEKAVNARELSSASAPPPRELVPATAPAWVRRLDGGEARPIEASGAGALVAALLRESERDANDAPGERVLLLPSQGEERGEEKTSTQAAALVAEHNRRVRCRHRVIDTLLASVPLGQEGLVGIPLDAVYESFAVEILEESFAAALRPDRGASSLDSSSRESTREPVEAWRSALDALRGAGLSLEPINFAYTSRLAAHAHERLYRRAGGAGAELFASTTRENLRALLRALRATRLVEDFCLRFLARQASAQVTSVPDSAPAPLAAGLRAFLSADASCWEPLVASLRSWDGITPSHFLPEETLEQSAERARRALATEAAGQAPHTRAVGGASGPWRDESFEGAGASSLWRHAPQSLLELLNESVGAAYEAFASEPLAFRQVDALLLPMGRYAGVEARREVRTVAWPHSGADSTSAARDLLALLLDDEARRRASGRLALLGAVEELDAALERLLEAPSVAEDLREGVRKAWGELKRSRRVGPGELEESTWSSFREALARLAPSRARSAPRSGREYAPAKG